MNKNNSLFRLLLIICVSLIAVACGSGGDDIGGPGGTNPPPPPDGNTPPLPDGKSKGLVFVAHTPNPRGASDIGTHTTTFGNSLPTVGSAPRGGSLFFLQADGTLRDLLDEALKNGCDTDDVAICNEDGVFTLDETGLLVNGYVVRRPIVHWDADRILFSMTFGTILEQHDGPTPADVKWQLYEITGLDPEDTPLLTKVSDQPDFNNVDGIYGSNDNEIFFISDKTVTGNPNHYPQRDEYESLPINTGLWKLDRETGAVTLMDHSPSGNFGPKVTPRGQLLFTRWDHLQADQQASNSMIKGMDPDYEDTFGIYTYASEDDVGPDDYVLMEDAVREHLEAYVATGEEEHLKAAGEANGVFPEPNRGNPFYNWGNKLDDDGNVRTIAGTFATGGAVHDIPFTTPSTEHGKFNYLIFNHFLPWQIRQDGEQGETYRHTGLHENGGFVLRSYYEDDALSNVEETAVRIKEANGFFLSDVHDDAETGFEIVTGVLSPEFGTHKSGPVLQFVDEDLVSQPQLHENGSAVSYRFLTAEDDERIYRDPIFLSDGRLIAAVSSDPRRTEASGFDAFDFSLHVLEMNEGTGFYEPKGRLLDGGIERTLDFWLEEGGQGLQEFSGPLWEMEPQEVIARMRPVIPAAPLVEDPEQDMFDAAGVTVAQFKQYLRNNNLAAIVVRNATVRDDADTTQPFNLVVQKDGENHEISVRGDYVQDQTKLYPISYLQLMRSDYLRGYTK
ncbi:MAG TPA: hypothetical protein VF275_02070, partial [Gammaproteobacteria bacterium]